MKRVLLLSLFCCLGFIALSQTTTIRIYAGGAGAAGSYITGNATSSGVRTDGNIVTTSITQRGYAVFDLSAIPSTATVTGVVTQFYVSGYGGSGAPSGWNTYGYAGDLSTVTSGPILFANMVAGTSLTTATYGTGTGNQTLASTPAAVTFVNSNIGNKVSWSWTGGGTRLYTITGETGTLDAVAGHAPYLEVTYTCAGVTGVAATATPNPVCPGNVFTISGAGTGVVSYTWQGPSSFSYTGMTTTLTGSATTVGVYTLTARNATGCRVITTTPSVALATAPTISPAGTVTVCATGSTALTASTVGGTWTSGNTAIATITTPGGILSGVAQGTANITYTNSTTPFCWAVKTVTVQAAPAPILPSAPHVCIGSTITLTDTAVGGTWSVTPTTTATITLATGVVTGGSAGTATVTYANGCGSPATTVITVEPLPAAITGPTHVCELGGIMTLSDVTAGGTWNGDANASAVAISATQGKVTGISDGPSIITYTAPNTCRATYSIIIDPAPNAITGVLKHCFGTATTLSNSIPGGTWSSGTPPVANLLPPPASCPSCGVFYGYMGGYALISYTNACGVATAMDTVVGTPPPFIGGDTVCEGGTLVLADSVIGGTWSSSDPSRATVLTGSGVVSGISVGVVTITYTLPPGCSRTGTVEVIVGPPAITGGTDVCPGKTTNLSNTSAGGTWSSGSPAVATVGLTSGVVTGVSSNTAIITYTDIHGCLATTMIIVNPLPPAIIGDSILCPGVVDTLYNPAIGGTWSSLTPGIATIGATTGIVNTVSGGTAVIRYTFTGTGCYISKNVTVHPAPAPVVTYNSFTNTFEATPGFVNYQWYNSVDGEIPGATYSTTAAMIEAGYYVKVLDSSGCTGTSNIVTFNNTMLGVNNDLGANSFRIYPNPASNTIFIDAPAKVNVVITDLAGRKEMEAKGVNKLDITKLTAGFYVINIYDEKGVKLGQQKLVKE